MPRDEEGFFQPQADGRQAPESLGVEDFAARVLAAVAEGGRRAALEHKRAGIPMAEWREGRLVLIPPEEIQVPETPARFPP
ncbi:MAG: hypothetical protein HQL63_03350 [Magnetococcales bacterium]|nr:hypothetical protein [Magnetococcales bacterium]MBF0322182.1 hypothetical protein [Magnetococcales bacterium]